MKSHCLTRLFTGPARVRPCTSKRRPWSDTEPLNRLLPIPVCLAMIQRFLVTALVLAGSLHAQDVTSPEPSSGVPDRAGMFDELVTGSVDEGERLLRNALELKPRTTPVELPLGHQLGYAACRAMEQGDWGRAVLLAGRAFAALDVFLGLPDLTVVQSCKGDSVTTGR